MTEPDAADLPIADATLTDLAVPSPEDLAAAHPCPEWGQHDPHRVSGEDGALVWSWECDGNGAPAVAAARELTWDDLPPRPWPDEVRPAPEQLVDYLLKLDYPQLVFLLGRQQQVWAQESRCFVQNHDHQLEELGRQLTEARVVTPTALEPGRVYVIALDEAQPDAADAIRKLADQAGCRILLLGPGARLLDPGAIAASAQHSSRVGT